jgi:Fe-S oxidoreductase
MARLKIEALAAYRARHPISLRDRLVAYLPRYAHRASKWRALANLGERLPSLWLERALGFSARRRLPRWQGDYLRGAADDASGAPNGEREVVLFVDTFTNYFAPKNAVAARRVLEAAGYRVRFNAVRGERPLCCGRTFLSAGLVDDARAEARRTLDALLPSVRRGVPIVGLEPSCLLGMRDEFLTYGFGDAATQLANQAFLFEEFLARERGAGRLELALQSLGSTEALVHAHCHQKAFGVAASMQTVLRWIPGIAPNAIETSCCGMAGSFGYEAEHYDISMRMAEASLLPAVRKAPSDALIVANGFSCSHQIRDGAGREPLHVAQVLERALLVRH